MKKGYRCLFAGLGLLMLIPITGMAEGVREYSQTSTKGRLEQLKPQELKQQTERSKLTLKLLKIKAHSTTEKSGDELYFDVLEFGDDRRARHFHIPKFPHHWPSSILSKINNIPLWQGTANKTGDLKLIVSLLEKDAPPWNNNDLIGAFEITIRLKADQIQFEVKQQGPNHKSQQYSGQFDQQFTFKSDKGEYQFSVSMSD